MEITKLSLKYLQQDLNEIKIDLCCLELKDKNLILEPCIRVEIFLFHLNTSNPPLVFFYKTLNEPDKFMSSFETQIVAINKTKAELRESCFLRIPVKGSLQDLKALSIMFFIQFPQRRNSVPPQNSSKSIKDHLTRKKDKPEPITVSMVEKHSD